MFTGLGLNGFLLYPPAATGESRGNPVPCCGQRIALRRVFLRRCRCLADCCYLRLFRATCAGHCLLRSLQHLAFHLTMAPATIAPRWSLRVVDSGLSSVRESFRHLQREACEAGKIARSRRDTVSPCCECVIGLDRRDSYRYVPVRTRSGKAPPADFGDEASWSAALLIHHVLRKLLRLLGRLGHVADR